MAAAGETATDPPTRHDVAAPEARPTAPASGLPEWAIAENGPETRRPPRWLPGLVVALCCVLVAGGMYVADRPSYRPDSRDSVFAAADGSAWYAARQSSGIFADGRDRSDKRLSVESARYDGLVAVQSLSGALATRALRPFGVAALEHLRFWRLVSTPASAGVLATNAQQTELFRIDGGIERVADDGVRRAHVFTPALVELPADAAPGSRWRSSGSAGDGVDYQADLSATAGAGGCLQVQGSVQYRRGGASSTRSRYRLSRTWCPGRGLVSESTTGDDGSQTTSIDGSAEVLNAAAGTRTAPSSPAAELSDSTREWNDPAGWTNRPVGVVSSSPGFGPAPMVDFAAFAAPAVTRTDMLLRATIPGDDLVGIRPPANSTSTGDWVSDVRMHPGGQILTLAAFGDLVLVSTTARRLVGYSSTGFRLWQRDLSDLIRDPPVRVDTDHVAAVTTTGFVMELDLRTGRSVWSAAVGADVEVQVAADRSVVAVADRSGGLTCFDAATGRRRWSRSAGSVERLLIDGDLVLAGGSDQVDAYGAAVGELRWRIVVPGQISSLAAMSTDPASTDPASTDPASTDLVVGGTGGSSVVGHDGQVSTHLDGYVSLSPVTAGQLSYPAAQQIPASGRLLGWREDGLEVLDLQGRVRGSLSLPTGLVLGRSRSLVSWSRGVLSMSAPGWTIQVVR